MAEKEKLRNKLAVLVVVYTFGVVLAALFLGLFRWLGWVKIFHPERFPHFRGRLIVVSNHPSLLVETILIPLLFWREYLRHPLTLTPWVTPDRNNFTNHWYWWWLKVRAISVKRGDRKAEVTAYREMKEVVNAGGIIHLLPEGGRTGKAKQHFESPKHHQKLGVLKRGAADLVLETGATLLPIWVDNADRVMPLSPEKLYTFPRIWKGVTLKIGQPVILEQENRDEVSQQIAFKLLELADEDEPR